MSRPLVATAAFQVGETVFLRWEVTDNDPDSPTFEQLVDADTALLDINAPDGTQPEDDSVLVNVATGIYRFDWDSAGGVGAGDYVAEATFTLGGLDTIKRLCFTLEA